jgi:hypothetical protein
MIVPDFAPFAPPVFGIREHRASRQAGERRQALPQPPEYVTSTQNPTTTQTQTFSGFLGPNAK